MIDVVENSEAPQLEDRAENSIQVWLVEILLLLTTKIHDQVFLHRKAAQVVIQKRAKEYIRAKLIQVWAEPILNDRVIYNRIVYDLDKSDGEAALRRQILSKLSDEEIEALGLTEQLELNVEEPTNDAGGKIAAK